MHSNVGCRSLLEAVRIFRRRRSRATLTDLTSFLCVCENEGASVKQLAYLAGTSVATMSRSIDYMAGLPEYGLSAEYLSLLRQCCYPTDGRRRAIFLTEEGERLKRDLEALLSLRAAAASDHAETSAPGPGDPQ